MLGANQKSVSACAFATIGQPRGVVFRFAAEDFAQNYRRWNPQVVDMAAMQPGPMREGLAFRQVTEERGFRAESEFSVEQMSPPSLLVLVGVSDPVRSTYSFEDALPDSTTVRFTFELDDIALPLRPFAKLLRSALEDGARQAVENLKLLLESEAREAAVRDVSAA